MTHPYEYKETHCKYTRIDDIIRWHDLDKDKVIPRYCNKEEIKDCIYCSLIKNNDNVKRIEKLPSYKTKPKLTFVSEKYGIIPFYKTKIKELYGKCNIKFRDICEMQYLYELMVLNSNPLILFQRVRLKDIGDYINKLSCFLKCNPEVKLYIILRSRALNNINNQLEEKKKNVTKKIK